ncbi:hypothetical protein ATANTOWER_031244 [Ataeniobius toweri]|uniref:Uncharacterized protein n=1 Tax=Ataeniobius toweri TaxID=208326 RepID=A0ABU7CF88_9TELE|nr:hypothetical protein [Ataeniobius toweri]
MNIKSDGVKVNIERGGQLNSILIAEELQASLFNTSNFTFMWKYVADFAIFLSLTKLPWRLQGPRNWGNIRVLEEKEVERVQLSFIWNIAFPGRCIKQVSVQAISAERHRRVTLQIMCI